MKKIKQSTFLALLLCSFSYVQAQTTISGTVMDTDGNPIYGATIQVLEQLGVGAITDENGMYSLTATTPCVIRASYSGYATEEQKVAAGATLANFSLNEDMLGFDEVVVTGSANPSSKINSSISVSSIKPEAILQTSPRTTAEIFRTIPGIRSESSGGEGNTNITVRGVPISSGGSKYLQLQEDGLPVFMFGDMAFATSDIFLRFDQNIARVEATRGGAASTMASNAPAGIINFMVKPT